MTLKQRAIQKYLNPLKINFFICYSNDVADDVSFLRHTLQDLSQDFSSILNLDVTDWTRSRMLDLHSVNAELQDVFDEKIKKSDYVIFLFHNRFGKYTMHEWYLCMENNAKKPVILLGLKQNDVSKYSLTQMRNKLKSSRKIKDVAYNNIEEFIPVLSSIVLSELDASRKRLIKFIDRNNARLSVDDVIRLRSKVAKVKKWQESLKVMREDRLNARLRQLSGSPQCSIQDHKMSTEVKLSEKKVEVCNIIAVR